MSKPEYETARPVAPTIPMALQRWMSGAILLLLVLVISGCAATRTMVGVGEPDFTKIQPTHSRTQVEQVLGKRLWRAGNANGFTYDIYQYKAGQRARPVTGTAVLAFDVISFGLFEYNVADAKKYAPVKQVAVSYDEHDRVQSVSPPWSVNQVGPCRRSRNLIPPNSAVPATARPSPLPGLSGPSGGLASLEVEHRIHAQVDGVKLEKRTIQLPPGLHAVSFSTVLGGSILYGSMSISYDGHFADVELMPGRQYRLKTTRLYGGYRSREDFFWIEDVESGEVLACFP